MYNERFLKAFEYLIKHEGGYVNHSSDPGGETKWGISKRSYPNLDIKNLTLDQAKQIYFVDFWKKGRYDDIRHDDIAIKLFDLTVNMGSQQAGRLIQRALRAVGNSVAEDGIVGNITLKSINDAKSDNLLIGFRSETAGYYRLLAAIKPFYQTFLNGWLNRAYA